MSSVNYTSFTHSLPISPSTCSKRMPTSVIALKILTGQSFIAKFNTYFAMPLFKDSLDLVPLANPLILSLAPFTLARTLTLTCIRVHSFRASFLLLTFNYHLHAVTAYNQPRTFSYIQKTYLITCSRGSKTLGSIRIIWKACSKSDFWAPSPKFLIQ